MNHEDPLETAWMRRIQPRTRVDYKLCLKRFLEWTSSRYGFSDGAGFLAWAEQQPKAISVQNVMLAFADTQPTSRRPTAMSALKTFLEKNGYEKRLPSVEAVDESERPSYRSFKREELILVLSYLDNPLHKLFFLVGKDGGWRGRTTIQIRYHHIKDDLEAGQEFVHVHFEHRYYLGKKRAGIGFIGPDAVKLIRELIKQGKISTQGNCNPEKGKCDCKRIFPFGYGSIVESIQLAMQKANIKGAVQPTHGLRRFYENMLDKPTPPIDDVQKAKLEGHLTGIRWVYREKDPEELRPYYARAYPYLTLSEEALVDAKYKALQDEIAKLKTENGVLVELRREFESIKVAFAEQGIKISYQRPAH